MTLETTPKFGAGRRVARVLRTLTLGTLFASGIVGLMMVLAGVFERKVDMKLAARGSAEVSDGVDRVEGVVKRVRRPRQESAVGTIRAVSEAVVASKLLARVEEVRVKAGQDVKQGDVLVVLDKADLRSRIEQALAEETSAKAKYDQAVIEQGRAERLRARESMTQSELDKANTSLRTARADLERSKRAVEETRIIESYATIRAPISGRVIDKKVNPGDTVSQGQPLVTMYDPTHMQLIATVRESLALKLKVGQELPARLDTFGYDCHATISEIVPEAQAESRSFQVEGDRPLPAERLQRDVRPDLHPARRRGRADRAAGGRPEGRAARRGRRHRGRRRGQPEGRAARAVARRGARGPLGPGRRRTGGLVSSRLWFEGEAIMSRSRSGPGGRAEAARLPQRHRPHLSR